MTGLAQPQTTGNGHTASFLFKILVSVLSVIITTGVLAMFNMNILLVRLDERFISVERRMVMIEKTHSELNGSRLNGAAKTY